MQIILLISIKALSTKSKTDLTEFILPGQAATLLSNHTEIEDVCDDYYRIIPDKIYRCTCCEENCNPTFARKFLDNPFLILMNLNIRSRNKNFYILYKLLVTLVSFIVVERRCCALKSAASLDYNRRN